MEPLHYDRCNIYDEYDTDGAMFASRITGLRGGLARTESIDAIVDVIIVQVRNIHIPAMPNGATHVSCSGQTCGYSTTLLEVCYLVPRSTLHVWRYADLPRCI